MKNPRVPGEGHTARFDVTSARRGATTPSEARDIARQLGGRVVVKAQIHAADAARAAV